MSPRLSCCQTKTPHGILCPLSRVPARWLAESEMFVAPVLGDYPAYSSPISPCIGAVPPPSRPHETLNLGGLTFMDKSTGDQLNPAGEPLSPFPVCFFIRCNQATFKSALSSSAEQSAYPVLQRETRSFLCIAKDRKKEVPQIFDPLPVGDLRRVWGWQLRLVTRSSCDILIFPCARVSNPCKSRYIWTTLLVYRAQAADGREVCQCSTMPAGSTTNDKNIRALHLRVQHLGTPSKSFHPYHR